MRQRQLGRRLLVGRRSSSRGPGRALPARGPRAGALLGRRGKKSARGKLGLLDGMGFPFFLWGWARCLLVHTVGHGVAWHGMAWYAVSTPPARAAKEKGASGSDGVSVGLVKCPLPWIGPPSVPPPIPEQYTPSLLYANQANPLREGATGSGNPALRRPQRHRASARSRSPRAWQSSSGGSRT